jgi:type I restriction enzyme, S subunit
MEVRAGYRLTEVGVIPEDWDIVPIGSLAHFTSGNGISVAALHRQSSDTPVPVYGGNGIAGYTTRPLVREPVVVVGRVGQKCGEVYLTEGPSWITDNALYPRAIFRSMDIRFLALALKAAGLNNVKNRNDLPLVTQPILHSVRIAFPPTKAEQEAIAAALGDVDALISGLDRLIAKKRAIKQGAMQQLLTGKRRLPGFSGESQYKQTEAGVIPEDWEVRLLGDLFNFSGGFSASRDQLSSKGHCYLHYGDIHKSSESFVDVQAEYQDIPKLDIPLRRVSPASLLNDGDVVFVDASEDDEGTSKHVVVINKEGTAYISGLHTIVAKSTTDALEHAYRRYCFQTRDIKRQFYFYSVGTKVSGISKTNIAKIFLPVPSLLEQTAIAAVLSDMDAEIAALEARRDKTRLLKQGMMQELLTGRVRLNHD